MAVLDYVSQVLTKTIRALASHPGRIAERMKAAYAEMHPVTPDKLPGDLRGDLVYIWDRLTAVKDDEKGHVPATIDSLSETELSEIAGRILSLADRVDAALREGRGG